MEVHSCTLDVLRWDRPTPSRPALLVGPTSIRTCRFARVVGLRPCPVGKCGESHHRLGDARRSCVGSTPSIVPVEVQVLSFNDLLVRAENAKKQLSARDSTVVAMAHAGRFGKYGA